MFVENSAIHSRNASHKRDIPKLKENYARLIPSLME